MDRRGFVVGICTLALPLKANAQSKLYRIGVVYPGGPYATSIDGLRDGLKQLGWTEGRNFVFHIRDVKGDLKAVEAAARSLELEKVDLIYAVSSSLTRLVKRATTDVPIVFSGGTGTLIREGPPESEFAAKLFESFGIARHRLRLGSRSAWAAPLLSAIFIG